MYEPHWGRDCGVRIDLSTGNVLLRNSLCSEHLMAPPKFLKTLMSIKWRSYGKKYKEKKSTNLNMYYVFVVRTLYLQFLNTILWSKSLCSFFVLQNLYNNNMQFLCHQCNYKPIKQNYLNFTSFRQNWFQTITSIFRLRPVRWEKNKV